MSKYTCVIIFLFFVALHSCAPEPIELAEENRFGRLPETPIFPSNNSYTPEKVKLGKLLFWDPVLSGNKDVACVTCHHPQNGYAEQLDLSIGVGGVGLSESRQHGTLVKRNAPTILNTAYNGINSDGIYMPEQAPMFWDNRNKSLEKQAVQPIFSAEEMRGTEISEEAIMDTVIQRLNGLSEYVALFEQTFGENSITEENIGKAIASFERTLVSNQSRFDDYVDGNKNALSSLELRGVMNFIEAGCANCHSGPMFSDYELHVLSVPENGKLNAADDGNGEFAFRTPTLRNLDLTAPYMHNGAFKTLEDVLEFYDDVDDSSQNSNVPSEQLDEKLGQLELPDDKVASILAFLNTLNDSNFDMEIPGKVPSGLSPGGNIK